MSKFEQGYSDGVNGNEPSSDNAAYRLGYAEGRADRLEDAK